MRAGGEPPCAYLLAFVPGWCSRWPPHPSPSIDNYALSGASLGGVARRVNVVRYRLLGVCQPLPEVCRLAAEPGAAQPRLNLYIGHNVTIAVRCFGFLGCLWGSKGLPLVDSMAKAKESRTSCPLVG